MRKCNTVEELQTAALQIRLNLLKLCHRQNIHIGGDLSITDVMTVLWQYQMNYDPEDIHNETRDRFILSKGHASAVTSFNQAAIGCFSADDVINEYATDGGRFSMHSCNLVNPYVEISTGSLGHGFPIACGIAQGLKLKNNTASRVYVVMGDGEQGEGSIWEAATNAVKLRLGNLVAMIDNNQLEADGSIIEVAGIRVLADRYRTLGWNVVELDGNKIDEIKNAFDHLPPVTSNIPTVFVCHTIKGKGVSFMENQSRWHAGKLNDEQYKNALISLKDVYGVEN